MVLLADAIGRFAQERGVEVRERVDQGPARELVAAIEEQIAPLRLPDELREFWIRWVPESVDLPEFYRLEEVLAARADYLLGGWPQVSMPLAYWDTGAVWMELTTDVHPGSRVFCTDYEVRSAEPWAIGVSGLLDIFAGLSEPGAMFQGSGESGSIPVDDRSLWPAHWQTAEGLAADMWELRGATHSVAEFDRARERGRVEGTLVGTWGVKLGGGRGSIGHLRDASGSLQAHLPVKNMTNAGPGTPGLYEVDVVGVPQTGTGTGSLPSSRDFLGPALSADMDALEAIHREFQDRADKLDTSVTIVAMRPIR